MAWRQHVVVVPIYLPLQVCLHFRISLILAGSTPSTTGKDALPLTSPPPWCPGLSVCLCPLDDLSYNTRCVVHLSTPADWSLWQVAADPGVRFGMARLHDALREVCQEHFVGGNLPPWLQHGVRKIGYLIQIQVVEDAVAPHDDYVALVSRDTMHCATFFYNLDCDPIVKVWVYPLIDASQLQRRLHVAINALHFRVEHGLQHAVAALKPPQDEKLAVTNGYHRNHGVQLPVYACAVVEHGEHQSCGTQRFCGLECLTY
mmetsp:Transcript_81200/g.161023  ORF Transcript_81200/g.161023 Transcript_81200/m.161023 type:complete len:259 (+) Transcript_81200:193-969(+)|eukprot:CAMPEP_0172716062 /NCGR_PEP_ID=MMETSP1074-20121228/67907_1 /TAXON_ID=2916 /ORGANISM="Ceratium fusus, Strain PA161109" /LENGTH=258 /DNA_ID=CAMNT_0013540711 /DNA_START=124 /DNA_END=900 /DNA_ORIENTATION=-